MAKIAAAYSTRDAKANREDLSDLISNIDPTETPFMTMIGGGARNASNINFDWQVDHLKPVNNDNAEVEGFEVRRQRSNPTIRVANTCQISTKNATVTGSQEKSDPAGKRSEMAYQMAMRSRELKIDMESIMLGKQPRYLGFDDASDETTQPRRLRAFEHWLQTNAMYGDNGANATTEFTQLTDGTQRNLTEAMLVDGLQSAWEAGGRPTQCLVGAGVKRRISKFVGRENSRQAVDKNTVNDTVSVYASDFGDITVKLSRWQRPRTLFVVDPSRVRLAYFRRPMQKPLAKVGDAETRLILAEYSLQVDNEAAHVKIADLTTTAPGA